MIDVLREALIDLRQVCREQPFRNSRTGRPAHISTVYRHVLHGARSANGSRIRLETCRTPSGLKTSREAIQRFVSALTNPDAPAATSPKSRKRAIDNACAELEEELGIAVS